MGTPAGHQEAPGFEGRISDGQKWGAGWRARAGARLGKARDAGVPGWRVIRAPTPHTHTLQCLEQQTEEEEVGEGVSEMSWWMRKGIR